MWIKNAWYVAAWTSEISADKLLSRIFLDTPVILYRTGQDDLVAMEDRCCHRHAPLSRGRLEGDDVRCMYHGLKFDPSGQCIEIPGEDKVPPQIKVQTFPVVEKNNLIWIWLGDAALADASDIVNMLFLDSPDWGYREGYLHYQADYRLIVDNLLDFTHLAFVHENSIGSEGLGYERPTIENREFGLRITNFNRDDNPAPHTQALGGFTGKVDRWTVNDWHLRGNLLIMDAGTMPAGSDGPDGDRVGAIQFRNLSALTPETATTCHYHHAQTQGFAPDDYNVTDELYERMVIAFDEDRDTIEAQQRVINFEPDRQMMPAPFDEPVHIIRRRMDEIVQAEKIEAPHMTIPNDAIKG